MGSEKSKCGTATVLTVMLGTFMSSLDINIVNIALPFMQSHFNTTIASIEWVIVAYLLTLGATLLTFGRLSDMFGHKKIYVTGFLCFMVSSLACALSPTLISLIVFRVTQALGAAMMQSSASPIITDAVEPQNRGKSLGMLAVAVAVSTCVGQPLGGVLAATFGYQSIFLINVPIGIIGTLLAFKFIKNDVKKAEHPHFDPAGSILIIAALFFILLPLDLLSSLSAKAETVALFLAAGIISLAAFIVVEYKSRHPILNLSLFKNRIFTGSNFAAVFFYMAEFILVFMSPYYLLKMRLMPAATSGLMLLPMSIGMIAAAPVSGMISDKFDSRYISSTGLAVMAAGILWMSTFSAYTPIPILIASFFIFGFGGGFFQTPNTSAVMGNVPAKRRGIASATLGTMRTVGMVIGEAASATIIAAGMNSAAPALAAKGLKGAALWRGEFIGAMHLTCIASAVCAILALILSLIRGSVKPTICACSEQVAVK